MSEISYGHGQNSGSALTAVLLDAEGESLTFVLFMPKSGTLNKIAIRTGTITTGGSLSVRIESIDLSSGYASGTLKYTDATGTLVIADGDDNITKYCEINSTSGVEVARGDLVGVVITAPISFVGNIMISSGLQNGFPYTATYLGGVAAKNSNAPCIVLETENEMCTGYGCEVPHTDLSNILLASDHSPDRVGVLWTADKTMEVFGFLVYLTVTGDFDFLVYGPGGVTVLSTVSCDGNVVRTGQRMFYIVLPSSITFQKGSNYRFVIKGTTTFHVTLYYTGGFTKDGDLNPASATGNDFIYTSCTGTPTEEGSWTDVDTQIPFFGLLASEIIEGGGGAPIIGSSIVRGVVA